MTNTQRTRLRIELRRLLEESKAAAEAETRRRRRLWAEIQKRFGKELVVTKRSRRTGLGFSNLLGDVE